MKKNTRSEFALAHRSVICFAVIMLLFLSCMLRLAVIATTPLYASVQQKQSSYKMEISRLRGTVFDRNMMPITNNSSKIMAAVSPTPRAVTAISSELKGEPTLKGVLTRLSSGKPTVCEVRGEIDCDEISTLKVYCNDSENRLAKHIIGYTDSSGHGVSGIEKAFDEYLYSEDRIYVIYETDGMGNVLGGAKPQFQNNTSVLADGVVTTLDINIQEITERSMKLVERGAAVVADVKSGEIRAVVSRPNFDEENIAELLNDQSAPLLNRALTAYSVGSVFKPCVAAAGLELKKTGFSFNCTGSNQIIDRVFHCHKRSGHGTVSLRDAMAYSCNSFFYNYAIDIGADAVWKMASTLSFGQKIRLGGGLETAAGILPNLTSLNNNASLANLSIGQGNFILSPIALLTLYCAIANDGSYILPSLVSATVRDGIKTEIKKSAPTTVMSKNTAETLRECLKAVITEGTGTNAALKSCDAAGKTATAQTGQYDNNGKEINNGWFCGFFPADNPSYAVVIVSENSTGSDVAKIFAELADGIYEACR